MSLQIIDRVVRREFRGFIEIGDAVRLTDEERRLALRLSEPQWAEWSGLLTDGPLPAEPVMPDMLQRLGAANYSLSMMTGDVPLAA